MAYGDFKDLTRRRASNKILHDKYLTLLKIRNMTDIKVDLLPWFIISFEKKTSGSSIKN